LNTEKGDKLRLSLERLGEASVLSLKEELLSLFSFFKPQPTDSLYLFIRYERIFYKLVSTEPKP
jgi:hypothetical protein